jgi:hypothetical protein
MFLLVAVLFDEYAAVGISFFAFHPEFSFLPDVTSIKGTFINSKSMLF